MKFAIPSLALAGLVALVSAADSSNNAFIVPTDGFAPVAGKDIQLQWDATAGKTVTLVLRSGASSNLKEGSAIAEKIDNTGSYTWSVPDDIVRGSDYTIEIINDDDPTQTNYFPYFVVDSTVTVASTTMSTYTYGMATTSTSVSSLKAASATAASHSSTDSSSTMTTSAKSTSASTTAASSSASHTASATDSSSSPAPTSAATANRVVAGGLALIVAAGAFMVL